MKTNPTILEQVLREAIADINKRPSHVEKTLKEMALHMFNITGGELAYILNGRTPVDNMSEDTMFKISRLLYEYMSNNPSEFDVTRLDVERYFTDNEQRTYKKKINRKHIDTDIICDYWVPIANDEVVIRLSNKQILELSSANRIHYNPETQRNLTEIEIENGKILKVTMNKDAIKLIGDDMESGDYIPNAITLNINPELYTQPKIINNKFVIPSDAVIDCINGYHRIKASNTRTKLNPDIEFNFIVIITGFDVKKAKRFIIQEDHHVPLTDEQLTQDDQGDAANFIIDKIYNSLYFKNSNIKEIAYQLNKIITQIFKPKRLKSIDEIQEALNIFKNIEKNMNKFIENNSFIGKLFTIEEWFIYLYIINYCNEMKLDFETIINKLNIDSLLNQISITKEPAPRHFKIMKEAIKNV